MLNELSRLSVGLRAAGVQPPSWHPNYKPCPKHRTYYLFINRSGRVDGATRITELSEITGIRKYEIANGLSFPALNVLPVVRVCSDEALAILKRVEETLKSPPVDLGLLAELVHSLVRMSESLWTESEIKKMRTCLVGIPRSLNQLTGKTPPMFSAWSTLIESSAQLAEHVNEIPDMLVGEFLSMARTEPRAALEFLADALVSTAEKDKAKRVAFVLEVADRLSFDRPASHPDVRAWVNECLMDSMAGANSALKDAFWTTYSTTDDEMTLPAARVPVLGNVILRAMSDESPCQRRYGRAKAASFPIGMRARQDFKDALEWISADERRGQTWQDVSDVSGGNAAVLFAYPETMPNLSAESAGIFAGAIRGNQGTTFSAVAERVVGALRLLVKERPDAQVAVFVLVKIDTARTKVLISRRLHAEALMESARAWRDGCRNIPPVFLRIKSRVTGEQLRVGTPFPTQVARVLKTDWNRDCSRTIVSRSESIADALDLFVGDRSAERAAAVRILDFVTRKGVWPLLELGHADHLNIDLSGPILKDAETVRLMPAVLGLCLSKLGIERRDYMRSAMFLVGKLLALADLLHREYCLDVRKGSIPTQLIGNALMPTALDNPEQALARLSERVYVYKSWVDKTYSSKEPGEKYALARWAVKQMGQASRELSEQRIPTRVTEADRAQILLGYLSRDVRADKGESGIEADQSQEEVM